MSEYFATSRDGLRPDVHMWETREKAVEQAMGLLADERFGKGRIFVVRVTVERISAVTIKPREFEVHGPDAFDPPAVPEGGE